MNKKIAIILFNLGGPSDLSEVKGFLFNLFNDKAIITLPNPFRFLLAKYISSKRENYAKEIYKKIGGKSPILEETLLQAGSLKSLIKKYDSNNDYQVFVSMRYSKPSSTDVIKMLSEYLPDEIILLPLYPQFSTTTTESSILDFRENLNKTNIKAKIKTICCYPTEENFISSHVGLIKESYQKAKEFGKTRILFSAHSLPQRIIDKGDSYQWQVELTVKKIIEKLGMDNIDYKICYQSKVGRLKWLGPQTEHEIISASKNNLSLIIVPIAFVSEHSETLVELDIDYKNLALSSGCVCYERVPSLSINNMFIESLANLALKLINQDIKDNQIASCEIKRICPPNFNRCINNLS
jgi:ferrochelatase